MFIERGALKMSWKEWVSALTGDSTSKVSEAEHDARDDSEGVREGKDPIPDSPPDWAETETDSRIPLFPEK